ncbi:MAG: S9 family peptidase [Bacteroidota bacterium]
MPRIPLRDFFRNPEKTDFKLSPDGQWFSWLAPHEKRMNLFVAPVDDQSQARRVTNLSDRDIAGYTWINNSRLLYARDFDGDENYHLLGVDLDGSNDKDLTPFKDVVASLIDDLPEDEEHVLISLNQRNPQIFDPYRLNVVTGELTLLAENPGNITVWMSDHNGQLRIAMATDGVNNSLLYRDNESDPFEVVITTNFRDSLMPLFFTFDNKQFYASSNLGRDKAAIVVFDPVSKTEQEVLFEHPEVDVEGLSYSRKRKVLTLASYTTWKTQLHFLDDERQALQEHLEAELPGKQVAVVGHNKAEDKFLIRTWSDRSLGAYYFFDQATKVLLQLANVSEWLPEDQLAEMQPIQYQSRDGLTINGYLTLPNEGEGPYPVVINPHGGPWARDVWTFNPEVQFLANRGYAVLQMNFRGSTGFGRAFWEASFKEWGLKMQDDVSDGVQWLIDQDIADPQRVAIYGGSYGGYATLAGITFTPDLYCCAIDFVGVSNLFTFMKTIPPYWKPYLDMLKAMVGDPENEVDHQRMTATSPVFHANQIKVPLLIAQGAMDPRVAKAESDQMVEALRQNGLDVEYLLKEDEGHGFRKEENRIEFYEAMEHFLEKHM